MTGVKLWLYLETWLWVTAWVMLFVAMIGNAVKAERESNPNRSPYARIWFN